MSKLICQHKWMMIYEGAYENPFMDMQPNEGVLVVAITEDDKVVCISEYSVAYGEPVLFLPGGAIDDGETPEEAANRELQEEAGFKAGRLHYLGETFPFKKYMRARIQIYLARDLQPSQLKGDEDWDIAVQPMSYAEFEQLIEDGQGQDASVEVAVNRARKFLAKENQGRKQ